jgi:hypothetical protein
MLRSRRRSAQACTPCSNIPRQAAAGQTLRQSGLVFRTSEEFLEHSLRAKDSFPQSQLEELPSSDSTRSQAACNACCSWCGNSWIVDLAANQNA